MFVSAGDAPVPSEEVTHETHDLVSLLDRFLADDNGKQLPERAAWDILPPHEAGRAMLVFACLGSKELLESLTALGVSEEDLSMKPWPVPTPPDKEPRRAPRIPSNPGDGVRPARWITKAKSRSQQRSQSRSQQRSQSRSQQRSQSRTASRARPTAQPSTSGNPGQDAQAEAS